MIQVACKQCWFVFEARRSSAKFCSAACRQKNHRQEKGQPIAKETKFTAEHRSHCEHCGDGFWQSGKGRKAKFCSNSCRQLANRAKISAAFRWYRKARKISDYEAFSFVESVGTDAIDRLAEADGWHYSRVERMYIKTQAYFSLDPMNFGIVTNG